jgi:hypothetical protein
MLMLFPLLLMWSVFMTLNRKARLIVSGSFSLILALGFSRIAIAEEAAAPGVAISDGTPVKIKDMSIAITPPAGWEVIKDAGSLSLVLQEAKPVAIPGDFVNPTYQRNLTVAVMHESSPIDAERAETLKDQLMRSFGKNSMISEFKITEHKFFDYRAKNDGLLVYASMKIGEFEMTQMHVLVSGAGKQVLMTYTDLASEFSKPGSGFDKAWSSIASIDVPGLAPHRYLESLIYGSAGGIFVSLAGLCLLVRRRRELKGYMTLSDEIYKDDHGLTNVSMIGSIDSVSAEALGDSIDISGEKALSNISNF